MILNNIPIKDNTCQNKMQEKNYFFAAILLPYHAYFCRQRRKVRGSKHLDLAVYHLYGLAAGEHVFYDHGALAELYHGTRERAAVDPYERAVERVHRGFDRACPALKRGDILPDRLNAGVQPVD